MNILQNLKDKAKHMPNINQKKIPKIPHLDVISCKLDAPNKINKTAKKLEGLLTITAHKTMTISSIEYKIHEDVDPVIGKPKEKAETLGTSITKKKTKLAEDKEKEFTFKVPISFQNEKSKKGGDMRLLNQMSERSKKTAINYDLIIEITYTILDDEEKIEHKKVLKQGVKFE